MTVSQHICLLTKRGTRKALSRNNNQNSNDDLQRSRAQHFVVVAILRLRFDFSDCSTTKNKGELGRSFSSAFEPGHNDTKKIRFLQLHNRLLITTRFGFIFVTVSWIQQCILSFDNSDPLLRVVKLACWWVFFVSKIFLKKSIA